MLYGFGGIEVKIGGIPAKVGGIPRREDPAVPKRAESLLETIIKRYN
ncbi:hypothetical protein [Neobacillus soli]|nr:hypothetical protein [Neobacillus soli]